MTDELTHETDIHTWFGLSYTNYLVLHRTLLQSMPPEWQARFTAMMDELTDAFAHVEKPYYFTVQAADEHTYGDLTGDQMRALGIVRHEHPCTISHDHEVNYGLDCDDRVTFSHEGRMDIDAEERVLVPCRDSVPPYNRGRAHIEPRTAAEDED